jgi:uncharacterized membrane protein YdcZ (DUF606 family)
MAEARVPATWFAQGYLPQICARHGVPASASQQRNIYSRPSAWLYLLILPSVLLFLIVVLIMRKTVPGTLPSCAGCRTDRRRYLLSVFGGWVGALAIFISAGFTDSVALLVLGALAVVAAVVWSCLGDQFRVRGSLSADQVWVTLRGADASFANQIQLAVAPTPQPQVVTGPPNAADPYVAPHASPVALTSVAAGPSNAAAYYPAGRDILPGR